MSGLIRDLDANQLGRHAFNVFLFAGRHQTGARLIYEALQLEPENAEAIRCLSDFMDHDGTEPLSAVALEYGLEHKQQLRDESAKVLSDLLFLAKWTWGFARHESGETNLTQEAFADQSSFIVDHQAYKAFLDTIVGPAGSVSSGFNAAVRLCGVMAGFLRREDGVPDGGFESLLNPAHYSLTQAHEDWLGTDTRQLDELEVKRQEMSTN